jgi:hypothetical protein
MWANTIKSYLPTRPPLPSFVPDHHLTSLAKQNMLITKTYQDVPSTLDGGKPHRIFVIAPNLPDYPHAKFPGKMQRISSLDKA